MDATRRTLITSEDADLYRGHILSWLLTDKGERIMRPNYGMKDYLFSAVPDLGVILTEIREGLEENIPDCQFQLQGSINELGEVVVSVYWAWKGEDQNTLVVTLTP